jgi:predicted amidohydrolase
MAASGSFQSPWISRQTSRLSSEAFKRLSLILWWLCRKARSPVTPQTMILCRGSTIETVRQEVKNYKVHLVIGACLHDGEAWRNSSLYIRPDGEIGRYDKLNLAISERASFKPGERLTVFPARIRSQDIVIGVQMCREIKYPEQWAAVAQKGASVIAFLNNAVGDQSISPIWRSHLVSRAAETQRFILAANNAAADQKCPSIILAPSGQALHEVPAGPEAGHSCELDLKSVSNWVLDQRRRDLFAAA